jgi:hypothetical protein
MHRNVNAALIAVFKKALDPDTIADMETDPNILAITDFIIYFDQYMRSYRLVDPLGPRHHGSTDTASE